MADYDHSYFVFFNHCLHIMVSPLLMSAYVGRHTKRGKVQQLKKWKR